MFKKIFACGCVIAVLFYGCVKRITIPNPDYAIGVVDIYSLSPKQANIHFHYSVNQSVLYVFYANGNNGWHVPADGHLKEGQQFIVQYNPLKVSEARMIFCYPIKDSIDYNQDVAQFEITPPSCY